MGIHPDMKADLAALVTAISLSGSEAPIAAALADEGFVPDRDAGVVLIERIREWVEAR